MFLKSIRHVRPHDYITDNRRLKGGQTESGWMRIINICSTQNLRGPLQLNSALYLVRSTRTDKAGTNPGDCSCERSNRAFASTARSTIELTDIDAQSGDSTAKGERLREA